LVNGALLVENVRKGRKQRSARDAGYELKISRMLYGTVFVVAQQVWKKILRLIAHVNPEACLTWVGIIKLQFSYCHHQVYEQLHDGH
jgi:hypothetical protein